MERDFGGTESWPSENKVICVVRDKTEEREGRVRPML